MNTMFKIRYHLHRALLTFLGPAELDDERDPVVALDREWQQRFGTPRRPARARPEPQQRSAAGRGLALQRTGGETERPLSPVGRG